MAPRSRAVNMQEGGRSRARTLTRELRQRARTLTAGSAATDEDFKDDLNDLEGNDEQMMKDMLSLMAPALPAAAAVPTLDLNDFDNLFLEYCAFHVEGKASLAPQNPAKAVRQKFSTEQGIMQLVLSLESLELKAANTARTVPSDRQQATAECLRTLAGHVRDNHDPDEAFLVYASTLVEAVLLDHSVRGEDLEGLMAILIERKRLIDEHRGATTSAQITREHTPEDLAPDSPAQIRPE